ncbi:twin-arginine translocase TatA/TatE family subunit [Legionella tunisiensis]|uniref:twin-arginine translocase TatA/TatE family subunit n=1 Tax=Legionella tunisiensis TaxID=1034944 RepID=UPI00030F6757|nr:twin-arginine translocase TatA/TatE family subunit [Legionella tunisiensis]
MSSGELLLTFLVAIVVFGPSKLPMLAEHLGKLVRHINLLKEKMINFWQNQLDEQQLKENTRKAEKADAIYRQEDKTP